MCAGRLALLLLLAGATADVALGQDAVRRERYVTTDVVATNQGTVLEVGTLVDVLGVIDVSRELAPSGKLVTFVFGEEIQTADYAAFAPVRSDAVLATMPVRAQNVGDRAELCTTLYVRKSQRVPDLSDVDLKKFLTVERDGALVTEYSLTLPKDHESDHRSDTDFCIGGLAFSANYQVTIRKGMSFTANRWPAVSKDINLYGRTRDRDPRILLDSVRYILPVRERSLLPVTTVNVSEVNVEVFRIDPRTLVSVPNLFAHLDGYDSRMLGNLYAESLGRWTTAVASELNESNSFNFDLGRIVRGRDPGLFVAVFSSPDLDQRWYENRPTQWFAHSDVGIATYSGVKRTLVALMDFTTLDPIAGATVQVLGGNNRELFAATSDGAGTVWIPQSYLAGTGGNAPHLMIVTTERGDFSLLEVANLKAKPRFLEAGLDKAHRQDVYLTVQRELYRLGDSVELAVIARDLQLEPLADFNLDVAFIDPRGSEVGTQSIITNEHGVAVGRFRVQPTDMLGPYEIRAARRDGIILASAKVTVDDFVPLTIDVAVSVGDDPWVAAGEHDFAIAAEYLSGGPARELPGDFRTEVRAVRSHTADGLEGFVFGPVQDPDFRFTTEVQEFTLDDAGQFTGSIRLDSARALPPGMYELRILAAVRDVGGRPNTTTAAVPLATHPSYVGVRSEFGERLSDGATAGFSVARIDRLGARLPDVELPYRIVRVRHS
ncbi:MAG: MG2 domain-containing protein, partial [Gammaproteobacteria bacterium]|nr:MG2 domain-containing protein [Gammaproteobacteria bacterium]